MLFDFLFLLSMLRLHDARDCINVCYNGFVLESTCCGLDPNPPIDIDYDWCCGIPREYWRECEQCN